MKYRSPSPPCLHPQLSPQGQRPSPPVQLSGVLIAKSALAHLGPLLCTMPVPLTFILKRVPSGVSTSIPRVACAGMGRKALLWSRAELGLLPGLSVPICEARKMMAPPHGCCEDELNVSKAQVQNQAPRTPHGWGLLALRETTRARGLLPPPPPS